MIFCCSCYLTSKFNGAKCVRLSAQYTDWNAARSSSDASVVEMLNDALYAAPATELAVLHSVAPSASTFVYCLNHSLTALGHGRPVHGDDLGLVFGAAINDGIEPFVSSGYSRLDRAVTEIVMTYWSNFVWTGSVRSVDDRPIDRLTAILFLCFIMNVCLFMVCQSEIIKINQNILNEVFSGTCHSRVGLHMIS